MAKFEFFKNSKNSVSCSFLELSYCFLLSYFPFKVLYQFQRHDCLWELYRTNCFEAVQIRCILEIRYFEHTVKLVSIETQISGK